MDLIKSFSNSKTQLKISLFGATLLSYVHEGREHIFVSPHAVYEGKPIRGGVPICWPWFGRRDGMLAHGVARTSIWKIVSEETTEEYIKLKLQFQHQKAVVQLDVFACEKLQCTLTTINEGDIEFPMTGALHTYWNIPVATAQIKYLPEVVHDSIKKQTYTNTEECLRFNYPEPLDRIYKGINESHSVDLNDLRITFNGCDAIVVWNPGNGALAMDDLKNSEGFVCVEAALLGHPPLVAGETVVLGFTVERI